jgi:L-histidine N-alpha-methyltransferase
MLFAHATMSGAHVFIDHSQFPENVQRDLTESLRARAINHKFHYDSYKQAAKWLALHEAFSPARQDESCLRIYDNAFRATGMALDAEDVHLIGLGCGGGQKESRLIELFASRKIVYTATDVSLPLVLTALEKTTALANVAARHGIVCDLATTTELNAALDNIDATGCRVVTLFGIIPNFEPAFLLTRVAALLRSNALFLFSANLAPGNDYLAGVRKVLPQYDNELTRDWLMTLLLDLGFERNDGVLEFNVEVDARQLQRITAHFVLERARDIRVFGETISFAGGERLRVFFSYRHTPGTVRALLHEQQIELLGEWQNDSGEEGVFLFRKRK